MPNASILTAHLDSTWVKSAPGLTAVATDGSTRLTEDGSGTITITSPTAYTSRNLQAIWTLDPTQASSNNAVSRLLFLIDASGAMLRIRVDTTSGRTSNGVFQKVILDVLNSGGSRVNGIDTGDYAALPNCDGITDIQFGHANSGAYPGQPGYECAAMRISYDNQQTWHGWYFCGGVDSGFNWDVITPAAGVATNFGSYPVTSRFAAFNGLAGPPPPPTITGLAVSLASTSVIGGQQVQATAPATLSDGTSRAATSSEVVWTESGGAGISTTGLANAPNPIVGQTQSVTVTVKLATNAAITSSASYTVPAGLAAPVSVSVPAQFTVLDGSGVAVPNCIVHVQSFNPAVAVPEFQIYISDSSGHVTVNALGVSPGTTHFRAYALSKFVDLPITVSNG